jgi:predicted metallopeptidase
MFVVDKSGAQWSIDESLKKLAVNICRNEDNVGHVDVDQVVFLRIIGAKATWMGKVWAIKQPYSILMRFAAYQFGKMGMLDVSRLSDIQDGLLDPRFIIALNHDLIMTKKEQSKVEYLTLLHEMMHIDSTMSGLIKHDIEDFASLVSEFGPYWTEGVFSKDVELGEAEEESE